MSGSGQKAGWGGKRAMDLLLVAGTAWLWVPLALLVGLLVWWRLGRPVFFCQERAGYGGRRFALIKFRTLTEARDGNGELLPDRQRMTSFGGWLRSSSLDELPELWNILRGEMSLVGPRPLPVRYVARYTVEQARRLESLPGLTGWAQVNGRNAVSWEERFARDVWYVENRCLWLDVKILWLTVWSVLRREGINDGTGPTMEEFRGTREPWKPGEADGERKPAPGGPADRDPA